MSKFTSGPWSIREATKTLHIQAGNGVRAGRQIARIIEHPGGLPIGEWLSEEDRENGRLIAAAPELLAALKTMTGFHSENVNNNPEHGYSHYAQQEIEKAWAAVIKAEGK